MKLIEKEEGERFKLKARDNNEIDTMFVDRRKKGYNYYHYPPLPSLLFYILSSLAHAAGLKKLKKWPVKKEVHYSHDVSTICPWQLQYVMNARIRICMALLT